MAGVRSLPPAASLAVASAGSGPLPLVCVRLEVDPGAGPADPAPVTVVLAVHPSAAARLSGLARPSAPAVWQLPTAAGSRADALAGLAAMATGRIGWGRTSTLATGRRALRRAQENHLELAVLDQGPPGRRPRPGRLELLASPAGRLSARIASDPLELDGMALGLSVAPRRLSARQAALALAAADRAGLAAYDATYPAWSTLVRDSASTSVALPVPGAPGLLCWDPAPAPADQDHHDDQDPDPDQAPGAASHPDGRRPALPATAPGVHRADELWGLLDSVEARGGSIGIHPDVLDAADAASALAIGRPGLRAHQDAFVATHLASRRGGVCAFAPGAGKTPTAAVALRDACAAARPGPWRAVVSAPAGVVRQWRDELARWFPAAAVVDADHPWSRAAPPGHPVVVLDSIDRVVARAAALACAPIDELVCDEAAVLASPGRRSSGLWELRRAARRALALAGAPTPYGRLEATAAVVAWALGQPDTFDAAALADPAAGAARPWRERLGTALVTCDPSPLLPPVTVSTAPAVPASPLEVALVAAADRVLATTWLRATALRDALAGGEGAGPARRALRGELGRVRLACLATARASRALAADPAALAPALPAALAADPVTSAAAEAVVLRPDGPHRRHRLAEHLSAVEGGLLVFCDSKAAAAAMAAELGERGRRVGVADGTSAARRHATAQALRSGQLDTVVATAAASVGMNLQAAATICHLDGLADTSSAHQRHGRAARLDAAAASIASWAPPPPGFSGWLTSAVAAELTAGAACGGDGSLLAAVAEWASTQPS